MKTKRRNFGSFFVRVGTSFLAFWLVLMGAFTLLLGQQRAQLMLSEMENRADFFDEISENICWIPRSSVPMIPHSSAGRCAGSAFELTAKIPPMYRSWKPRLPIKMVTYCKAIAGG